MPHNATNAPQAVAETRLDVEAVDMPDGPIIDVPDAARALGLGEVEAAMGFTPKRRTRRQPNALGLTHKLARAQAELERMADEVARACKRMDKVRKRVKRLRGELFRTCKPPAPSDG